MSLIGWILMVINLCIGITTLIASFLSGQSVISQPRSLVAVLVIAIIIGILAVADMIIYKTIRKVKIFS
jgi:hypothetical protein